MKIMKPRCIANNPLVSIIMPVRNEAQFIQSSLGAIFRQTYPSECMEVIVADGMSVDNTRQIIRQLAAEALRSVRIVDNVKGIAPSGLNCALREAAGSIIIRIDGHCEIDSDYVENCVKLLRAGKADGVGGPIETIGKSIRAKAIALAMSSSFGVGGSAFRTINDRQIYTDTVAFPAYTREIIRKTGLFNEELVRNQDDEYNYRIRKMGGRILLSPNIRSRYYSRSNFLSLWRQYYQYGYWKVRILQLHPHQMSFRQFVPFFFVLSLMITLACSFVSEFGRVVFGVIVVSYLAINLASAVYLSGKQFWLSPFLAWSFCNLHLSYGLGSMAGLFAFRNHWNKRGK